MNRILKTTALAAGLMCGVFATQAQAQTITIKVHHFLNANSVQHTKMLRGWCDNIAKDSANRLQCQIFPSMQLGGTPAQLYDQARDGVADVVWTLPGYTSGRFPRVEVFELPFTMTNAEATSAAAWEYYEKHAKEEFKDTKMLAVHVHGPGNIFTAKKQIKTLADIKGMKLRAPTRLTTKLLASLGATPVGMPVPAVPDALSKGVIDGAVIPYQVAPSIKIDELTKFTAETDRSQPALYTSLFVLPMNKAKYDSLPPDLQKVIDKNSGRELSAWLGKTMADDDIPGKEKIVAAKNIVSVIPAAELQNWIKASENVDDEWVAEVTKKGIDGKALLADAKALIKKNTK